MSAPHNIGVFVEKILFLAHVDEVRRIVAEVRL